MLISIVLLSVSGLLLLAADGLAQIRLGRPQAGLIGRVGLMAPRWAEAVGHLPISVVGKIQGTGSLGTSLNAKPKPARRL